MHSTRTATQRKKYTEGAIRLNETKEVYFGETPFVRPLVFICNVLLGARSIRTLSDITEMYLRPG